jgi:hypothetical protein
LDYAPGALTIDHTIGPVAEWTFLVYLDGDNDLEPYTIQNVNRMEQVGSTDKVNILVQIDRIPGYDSSNGDWTGTRRYYITKDSDPNTINSLMISDLGEVNMGDPKEFIDFAKWAMSDYPAKHYAFVFMNHGGGWKVAPDRTSLQQRRSPIKAICWDDTSGDTLYMKEVKDGLLSIRDTKEAIDLVGFDACLMAMVEVAYEIREGAKVMVASENVEWAPGWPYSEILTSLTSNPYMTPKELGGVIVDHYEAYWGQSGDATQSAVDLTLLDNLAEKLDLLAKSMDSYWNEVKLSREASEEYYLPYYIDLYSFAHQVYWNVPDTTIKTCAQDVKDAIASCVIEEYHGSGHPGSAGLTIFFPHTQSEYDPDYNELQIDLPGATYWDEFLTWYTTQAENIPPTTPVISSLGEVEAAAPFNVVWSSSYDSDGVSGYELQESAGIDYVVSEGFEDELTWEVTGLWHKTTHRKIEGAYSFYYGQDGLWDYDTGDGNAGTLTTQAFLLPEADSVELRFSYWLQTEDFGAPYDCAQVLISTDSGGSWKKIWERSMSNNKWEEASLSLTEYAGQTVRLRFSFDTVDGLFNDYEGWYIDEVVVSCASWFELAEGEEVSFEVPGRPAGTYYYRVRARDTLGLASPWSDPEDVVVIGGEIDTEPPVVSLKVLPGNEKGEVLVEVVSDEELRAVDVRTVFGREVWGIDLTYKGEQALVGKFFAQSSRATQDYEIQVVAYDTSLNRIKRCASVRVEPARAGEEVVLLTTDGKARIELPSGVLTEDTLLLLTESDPQAFQDRSGLIGVGKVYTLGLGGVELRGGICINVAYDMDELRAQGMSKEKITGFTFKDGRWVYVGGALKEGWLRVELHEVLPFALLADVEQPICTTLTLDKDSPRLLFQVRLQDRGSGLSAESIEVALNKEEVPFKFDQDTGVVTYRSQYRLRGGTHCLTISCNDRVGNTLTQAYNFSVTVAQAVNRIFNYPNPFNPEKDNITTLRCELLAPADDIALRIYDVSGELVREVRYPGEIIKLEPGDQGTTAQSSTYTYEYKWDGRNEVGDLVGNGVYIYMFDVTGNPDGPAFGKCAVWR